MLKAKRDKAWVDICEKIEKEVNAITAPSDPSPNLTRPNTSKKLQRFPQPNLSESEVTPTPIAETQPPAPAPLSTGQRHLSSAAAQVAAERQRQDAERDALRQQQFSRKTTRHASWGTIRAIFDRLWDQIRDVAPDVERLQADTTLLCFCNGESLI